MIKLGGVSKYLNVNVSLNWFKFERERVSVFESGCVIGSGQGANFFKIIVKNMSVKSLALVFLSRLDTLVRGLNSCLKCDYRKYNDD